MGVLRDEEGESQVAVLTGKLKKKNLYTHNPVRVNSYVPQQRPDQAQNVTHVEQY